MNAVGALGAAYGCGASPARAPCFRASRARILLSSCPSSPLAHYQHQLEGFCTAISRSGDHASVGANRSASAAGHSSSAGAASSCVIWGGSGAGRHALVPCFAIRAGERGKQLADRALLRSSPVRIWFGRSHGRASSTSTFRQRRHRRRRPAVRSRNSSASRTVRGSAALADGCGPVMAVNGITNR